ncbi:ComF family protein [Nitrospina watsonii]|uniref:Phosphoribosyltransferase domain-containing protein n=1 Tax=Nitrospina watsonii TaxID=1323948 RepID=A0ABM9HGA8_9BACT|nr:phosphoribosyltransferase family protein [Nitrospina watsonii]CAI2719266.1 conserved protein of unknown function [Nitrospina watsonii]
MIFSREDILKTINSTPRRRKISSDFKLLKPPGEFGDDWNLFFPFGDSYIPAFESVFSIETIGFRKNPTTSGYYTYLKNVSEWEIEALQNWLAIFYECVTIRDCLTMSFALDFDRTDGNPENEKTNIGTLRENAKPYDKPLISSHIENARKLAELCVKFLERIQCYNKADVLVGVPPSDPTKSYNLPSFLANEIGRLWNKENFSDCLRTLRPREGLKSIPIKEKLNILEGTIEVDSAYFKNKRVLLIDDLYQSGITMNYVGMLLLEAGAREVYGLACEKTCRNDDNVSS